jgi:hypothetical protein
VPTYAQIAGSAEWQHGPGSYDDPLLPYHILAAPVGELRWAIYRLAPNGFPVIEELAGITVSYGEAWIGLANYARASWDFYGPAVTPLDRRDLTIQHVSPGGFVYVAVAAYDVAHVTVNHLNLVTDQPGWLHTTVDGEAAALYTARLFSDSPDGAPRIAALSGTIMELLTTATTSPIGESDWDSKLARNTLGVGQLTGPLCAEFINGRPAVACYYHDEDYQAEYTYATADEPGPGDWVSVSVGDPLFLSAGLSLCEFHGRPYLSFVNSYLGPISIFAADSAAPGPGDWQITEIVDDASQPQLTVLNGRLALCYWPAGATTYVSFARALVEDPSGPDDWTTLQAHGPIDVNSGRGARLITTRLADDYVPFIAFTATDYDYLHAMCGKLPEPAAPGDWSRTSLEGGSDVAQLSCALVGGRPAIAYYLPETSQLRFAWAVVSAPTTDEDWEVITLVNGAELGTISIAEVGGQPAIMYIDRDADVLKYAYPE